MVEAITAHPVHVTAHMDALKFHIEIATAHIEDLTELKNRKLKIKAPLNTLSNLPRPPMKNGEAIFIRKEV